MEAVALQVGDELAVDITRMAHGGSGIGTAPDGRVVFVPGSVPGDSVRVCITKVKKRWIRARLTEVVMPSAHRVPATCPAARAGAGCCDYSHIDPSVQLRFKREILLGQLQALAQRSGVLATFDTTNALSCLALEPHHGWRTRVRLGVDDAGQAGIRRARSHDIIDPSGCMQPIEGLMDGVNAMHFTPGSEVVAVRDANGDRHIVEVETVPRGQARRAETLSRVVEGSGVITERVGSDEFEFPATVFWQAHKNAPETYASIIADWGEREYTRAAAWDLYGGVGAFGPSIAAATGCTTVHTVDSSPAATTHQATTNRSVHVEAHSGRVEDWIHRLPAPGLVVLDPPRLGAGERTVAAIAAADPERVIHVGCDPSTFSRDLGAWGAAGFRVDRLVLVDAFPNTHHFETIAQLSRP